MIDEKKIEEAAKEYAKSQFDNYDIHASTAGFIAGINWFLDNLLRKCVKTPPYDKPCEAENNKNEFHKYPMSYYSLPGYSFGIADYADDGYGVSCQLYIDDFLKGGKLLWIFSQ